MGVIIRSAWVTIAEQILSRSLPLVVYALKGCLPELKVIPQVTISEFILFFYKVFHKEKY